MALNLKTLGIRAGSAAVFVVLLVGCVYWNYLSFTLFFFVVAMLGLHEYFRLVETMGHRPLCLVGYICGALIYISQINSGHYPQLRWLHFSGPVLLYMSALIMGISLFARRDQAFFSGVITIGGIMYCVLPFALLHSLHLDRSSLSLPYEPWLILGIIFLIWSNDTFAYLGGSLFGKHKMIERVSPGKTWEGTAIGVLITFGLSFFFSKWIPGTEKWNWPVTGLVVPIAATVGDLVESKLKREAGVKDSGHIMPGHGGILDRFDSLIFVAPFAVLLDYLFRF